MYENGNFKKTVSLFDTTLMLKIYQDVLLKTLLPRFDAYIVVKGDITVTKPDNGKETKVLHLKAMHHLSTAFQKLMVHKLSMQTT